MFKGVFHYNLNPRKWRWGREIVVGPDQRVWCYLMLGPVSINLGHL